MQFTETELTTISNALRVAAERFRENITTCINPNRNVLAGDGLAALNRLGEQFERQATAAMTVYDRIADRTGIAS